MRRMKKQRKNIWRNNGQISSTFDKNGKASNQEVQQTPSLRNIKHLGTPYYKCIKQMIKRSWKQPDERKHFQYSEVRITGDFTLEKCMRWQGCSIVILLGKKEKKKKGVDLNFYTWQIYISKKYFFRHTKAEKNFISNTALQLLQ